jgi:D-alanine-D-alanine ligase
VWEHGSLGLHADSVVAVKDAAGLRAEILARRDRLGGEAFAEAFLDGREFNLAILTRGNGLEPHAAGDDVEHLPAAEIRFDPAMPGPRIVGYEAKWAPGSPQDLSTPRAFELPPATRLSSNRCARSRGGPGTRSACAATRGSTSDSTRRADRSSSTSTRTRA